MSKALGGAITGRFPSLKIQRLVHYASSIERDFLFFVEFDSRILSYCEQPFCLAQTLVDGCLHLYTPDFLLQYADQQVLVECKPINHLDHPHTQQQCQMGQQWADETGGSFRLVTDTELRTGSQLANLKLLWRYSRLVMDDQPKIFCLQIVSEPESITLGEVCRQLEKYTRTSLPLVCHLLFHHYLQTDLHQPLSPASRLNLGA